MNLGDRIITAREQRGLSRLDLATRLGVSEGGLGKWERGERAVSVEDLCRLSDVLGVTVGWLVGRRQRGRPFTKQAGINPPPTGPHPVPVAWPCLSQPQGCTCRCHAVRAGKLRSEKAQQAVRRDVWTTDQDTYLRERLAAGILPSQVAVELSERWPETPRTETGVKTRAGRLGISLYDGWTSSTQLARKLGVGYWKIERWREDGYLHDVPGFKQWLRFLDHEIEAFVKAHAGTLFDPRLVRDPKLKALAETSAIVNRRKQAG